MKLHLPTPYIPISLDGMVTRAAMPAEVLVSAVPPRVTGISILWKQK